MADALVPIRQAVPIGSITFVHRSRASRNQPSQEEEEKKRINNQPRPFGYQQVPFTWIPFPHTIHYSTVHLDDLVIPTINKHVYQIKSYNNLPRQRKSSYIN